MIENVIVLGAGSAGLIAALSLKRKIPQLRVRVVRSPDIGVIGVGEGTTPNFPRHIFDYLGIPRKRFYELAEPTWKLGIRFLWGERGRFDYTFAPQLDSHWSDLPRPNGYYCDDDFANVDITSALMREGKVFQRQANGAPDVQPWHAFHVENKLFVDMLETIAREAGVQIVDGRVIGSDRGDKGITAIHLEDGQRLEADFFIDASGFRSELLGKAFNEPFNDFGNTLFCDRAVIGGWDRTNEPILPYTTAEQMDAGWAWQIEHERHINRGYVFSSQFLTDDQAAEEFKRKNPKAPEAPRVVKFRSGAYKRMWVDNVVAIGNAGGFVEPLEATALMIVCSHCQTLVDFLLHSELSPTDSFRDLYNELTDRTWGDIRDFLGLHYKGNTAMDTPFWQHCRADTDLSGIQGLIDFYEENGPTGFCRYRIPSTQNDFGIEGYFVMLVGNRWPYKKRHKAGAGEKATWEKHRSGNIAMAKRGIDVREALSYVRHPGWQWNADVPQRQLAGV
ncbi:FAD-dependent oxidoreductase [Haloferula sp. BvORR071]|uniref:FAD-dependent oxidoreductase n=1 Tax=Haloferula sp. BvORR071 TaxID=1396141 RepID=UPI00054DB1A4|nr:FAD-dependent oxidoreductase [Haloferula sp. BvORR071]